MEHEIFIIPYATTLLQCTTKTHNAKSIHFYHNMLLPGTMCCTKWWSSFISVSSVNMYLRYVNAGIRVYRIPRQQSLQGRQGEQLAKKQQVTFFKILVTHFHTSYEQRKGRTSDYYSTDSTLEMWLNAIARDCWHCYGPSNCALPISVCHNGQTLRGFHNQLTITHRMEWQYFLVSHNSDLCFMLATLGVSSK